MKRILFVHQTSAIGGGSFCMLNVIRELDKTLFHIEVLVPKEGPLCTELRKLSITVHTIGGLRGIPYNRDVWKPKFALSYFYAFKIRKKIRSFIREHSYDIIYLNSMMLYPLLKTIKKEGIKAVIHIREHWPLKKHRLQLSYAQKHIEKYADQIFAINKYSASMFPISAYKCAIVYDWIDMTDRYEYRPFEDFFGKEANNYKVFLYTGGFDQFKGIKDILYIFRNIKDSNARLLILGELPESSSSDYLKECISLVNTDSRIRCIPKTYKIRHLVEQAYCVLSAFTIPHANLGLAEAIWLNKVSVAARNEESLEYSFDGTLAVLFAENDLYDFYQKVVDVDNHYSQIEKSIKENSYKVRHLFDKEKNVAVLNKTLKSI